MLYDIKKSTDVLCRFLALSEPSRAILCVHSCHRKILVEYCIGKLLIFYLYFTICYSYNLSKEKSIFLLISLLCYLEIKSILFSIFFLLCRVSKITARSLVHM